MKTSHLGPKNLVIRLVVTDQSFGIVVQVLQACKATGGTRQAYPGFQDHDSWRKVPCSLSWLIAYIVAAPALPLGCWCLYICAKQGPGIHEAAEAVA